MTAPATSAFKRYFMREAVRGPVWPARFIGVIDPSDTELTSQYADRSLLWQLDT